MAKKFLEETMKPRERTFAVGVEVYGNDNLLSIDDFLKELALLADTAGLEIVGQTTQKLDHPHPKTYIGLGKVEEVKALIEENQADVLLFDDELSPRHLRELEEIMGDKVRILDRTALILDIFAQHASTREGTLQVELATYEYRLPRLTRAWTHLARQSGGGGGRTGSAGGVGLRGPGETQLEVDRREIRKKIDRLKDELEKVRVQRSQQRARRKQSRTPIVALVGYTNTGKSTLLNRLTEAGVYVADQLFATLDPTTRRVELPGGQIALFTDTVGFIQKLPTTLVAAFRATLEEIADADLLLHIVDITHPNVHTQAKSVLNTLKEIEASHIPVITVLNKVDLLTDPEKAQQSLKSFSKAVAVSALKGKGISELLSKVNEHLFETYIPIHVFLPFKEGGLISLFHESGEISHSETIRGGMIISGKLPGRLVARYQPFTKLEFDQFDESDEI